MGLEAEIATEPDLQAPGEEWGKQAAGPHPVTSRAFLGAMVTLIDYGIGNMRSLAKAFAAAGLEVERTDDPARVEAAERLVLPGVGAFQACADAIWARGLWDVVFERARAGVPLLGVCVGMQLLFESSEEGSGDAAGLGLLPGRVVRFRPDLEAEGRRLKVPHMGWNELVERRAHDVVPTGHGAWAYFVHSYHAAPADPADVLATVEYGVEVPAVVGRGAVVGAQFHPEKSGRVGLEMLRRFAAWSPSPAPSSPVPV